MSRCQWLTIYYTLRYGWKHLLAGQILVGHDFEYNGEVCGDHWHMTCKRCGYIAAIEVGPNNHNKNA